MTFYLIRITMIIVIVIVMTVLHYQDYNIINIQIRSRAEATFMDPEFQENIEQYFVENIKVGLIQPIL